MKNHISVDGRLLQTNKRFSHLKEKQKTWVMDVTRQEYCRYVAIHKKQPSNHAKDYVLWAVNKRVIARDIWLPGGALGSAVNRQIDRLNRRYAFMLDENGDVCLDTDRLALLVKPSSEERLARDSARPGYKPLPTKVHFSDMPDEFKSALLARLEHDIATSFRSTGKPPSDKAKSSFIKTQIKYINSRRKRLKLPEVASVTFVADDTLRVMFDALVEKVRAMFDNPENV